MDSIYFFVALNDFTDLITHLHYTPVRATQILLNPLYTADIFYCGRLYFGQSFLLPRI